MERTTTETEHYGERQLVFIMRGFLFILMAGILRNTKKETTPVILSVTSIESSLNVALKFKMSMAKPK